MNKTTLTALSLICLLCVSRPVFAQETRKVDLNSLITECTKSTGELTHRRMAIWFPVDFWRAVGQQMKITPETMETIIREMNGYMMFCVVDYSLDGVHYVFRTDSEIRPSLKMVDSLKTIYLPAAENDLSPLASSMLLSMRPTLAKMLGQMGEGMQIYLFDIKGSGGKPLVFDIGRKNRFLLTWGDVSLKWSLPLAAALPSKYCPIDQEVMKGNWDYCPFHGVKLN